MQELSDQDLEIDVANSVLLPGEELTEEERQTLPEHVQKRTEEYCKVQYACVDECLSLLDLSREALSHCMDGHVVQVRNHILTMWRADVAKYLSKQDSEVKLSKRSVGGRESTM